MARKKKIVISIEEEQEVKPTRTTHVAIVIDRSGSMSSCKRAAVDSFNEQLDVLKSMVDADNKVSVTVIWFDSFVNTFHSTMDVNAVPQMGYNDFRPTGLTALNDGIGYAIERFLKMKASEDDAFLVTTISDGGENNSKQYNAAKLRKLIRECEDSGKFTFTYLGANQNLDHVEREYGFHKGNMKAWVSTDELGARDTMSVQSVSLGQYMQMRKAGGFSTTAFYGNQ